MSNPLDRWPVEVCGKCGGRTCQACRHCEDPRVTILMQALDKQVNGSLKLASALEQTVAKLEELHDRLRSLKFDVQNRKH